MKMLKKENGEILITGDADVIKRTENEDLSGVDVSVYRLDADQLAKLYLHAQAAKEYVVLKDKYLEMFSAK